MRRIYIGREWVAITSQVIESPRDSIIVM